MTIDEIEAEAADIAELAARIKRTSMIYQVREKERIAQLNGLPFDAYYDLPYAEWAAIRDGDAQGTATLI